MFTYCLNSPVDCIDTTGYTTRSILGDCFDLISDPWREPGGAGGQDKMCICSNGPAQFALLDESATNSSGRSKNGKLLSGEFSGISFGYNSISLFSFDFSAIALDLVDKDWELSLFDLGNISAGAGFYGCFPYVEAMVSIWSPSYTFDLGGARVTITAHVGAWGGEFKISPEETKFGVSSVVGFSVDIS